MAADQIPAAQAADLRPGGVTWRKRVAVLLALTLAAAGLYILERSPSASAAAAPRVVHASTHASAAHAAVDAQVASINAMTAQLRGAASLVTATIPDLDANTAASTADLAASANHAALLSQRLASIATSKKADPVQANTTAGQLRAALAATQAKAAVVNAARITLPIQFCNFTIQIGPIIINIPRLGIHIVIGPFFVHFRAPCFLSGRIPTHVP